MSAGEEMYRREHHFVSCFVTVRAVTTEHGPGRVTINAGATLELVDAIELAESILSAAGEVARGVIDRDDV